jgi:hypothetical protein
MGNPCLISQRQSDVERIYKPIKIALFVKMYESTIQLISLFVRIDSKKNLHLTKKVHTLYCSMYVAIRSTH